MNNFIKVKKEELVVNRNYRFIHRDYGEVVGELTLWDFNSGHMEVTNQNGDVQPMNIKFVEAIYA